MTVVQHPDVQFEEATESGSFDAENCLGMVELAIGFKLGSGTKSSHPHRSQSLIVMLQTCRKPRSTAFKTAGPSNCLQILLHTVRTIGETC